MFVFDCVHINLYLAYYDDIICNEPSKLKFIYRKKSTYVTQQLLKITVFDKRYLRLILV